MRWQVEVASDDVNLRRQADNGDDRIMADVGNRSCASSKREARQLLMHFNIILDHGLSEDHTGDFLASYAVAASSLLPPFARTRNWMFRVDVFKGRLLITCFQS